MSLLRKIAIGAWILGAIAVSPLVCNRSLTTVLEQPERNTAVVQGNRRAFCNSAVEYQRNFFGGKDDFKGYVRLMEEAGMLFNPVKKNVEARGREAVVLDFAEFHKIPLEWAVSHDSEPSENDLRELGLAMLAHQSKTANQVYVNYHFPELHSAAAKFAGNRIEFYQLVLLKSGGDFSGTFEDILRRSFSRKEFISQLENYQEIRRNFYKATAASISTYENTNPIFQAAVRKFGPGIALIYMGESDKINAGEAERIYGQCKERN